MTKSAGQRMIVQSCQRRDIDEAKRKRKRELSNGCGRRHVCDVDVRYTHGEVMEPCYPRR